MEVNINEIERFIGYKVTDQTEEYVCLLAGQLSAGKTKFINRIMGHDYLPVGTGGTTAVPTYVKKGDSGAVLYDSAGRSDEILLGALRTIKKGKCDCEKINMTVAGLPFSEKVTFIDTPGVNSTSSWDVQDLLKLVDHADVVFYFLPKSLSSVDVEVINQIYSREEVKLIIVRTGIDRIKASEEDRGLTYAEEKMLASSIYPAADFYFVSLEDEETELNQLALLMAYVSQELEGQLCERKKEANYKYCREFLLPALDRMREEIENASFSLDSAARAEKRLKKQLREIKKSFEACEVHIREQFSVAKRNYIENGKRLMEKEGKSHIATGREIQSYILGCMIKLEEWFGLEFEDIISGITSNAVSAKRKNLLSEDTITQIFRKLEKRRTWFADFTFMVEEDSPVNQFETTEEAKRYMRKLIDSIFIRLDADFMVKFAEHIDGIMEELEIQYKQENEMLQEYAVLPVKESKEKIDRYIKELLEYGRTKGTA